MTIESVLYSRLTGFAGLSALVGSRVYPTKLKQDSDLPALVYWRVTAERPAAMARDSGIVFARFQVGSFAKRFDDANDVRAQVRAALKRWSDPGPPEVLDVFLQSEVDLFEDDTKTHHLADDYRIAYRE